VKDRFRPRRRRHSSAGRFPADRRPRGNPETNARHAALLDAQANRGLHLNELTELIDLRMRMGMGREVGT